VDVEVAAFVTWITSLPLSEPRVFTVGPGFKTTYGKG
jgi:hypothetical protein